jgi:hypothetical protein
MQDSPLFSLPAWHSLPAPEKHSFFGGCGGRSCCESDATGPHDANQSIDTVEFSVTSTTWWRRTASTSSTHSSMVRFSFARTLEGTKRAISVGHDVTDSYVNHRPLPPRVPWVRLCWFSCGWRQEKHCSCVQRGWQGRQAQGSHRGGEARPDKDLRLPRRYCPHTMGHTWSSFAAELSSTPVRTPLGNPDKCFVPELGLNSCSIQF